MTHESKVNLTGQVVGSWTVLGQDRNPRGVLLWRCRCQCGTEKLIYASNLRSGGSTSCGCQRNEGAINMKRSYPRLHRIWSAMNARCTRADFSGYNLYGGRGIAVCEEWKSFENFRDWAFAQGYDEHLDLIRIDQDAHFTPANCEWIDSSRKEAGRLLRQTNDDGELWKTIALRNGIKAATFRSRIYTQGWPLEKAATVPTKVYKNSRRTSSARD